MASFARGRGEWSRNTTQVCSFFSLRGERRCGKLLIAKAKASEMTKHFISFRTQMFHVVWMHSRGLKLMVWIYRCSRFGDGMGFAVIYLATTPRWILLFWMNWSVGRRLYCKKTSIASIHSVLTIFWARQVALPATKQNTTKLSLHLCRSSVDHIKCHLSSLYFEYPKGNFGGVKP